MERLSTTHGKQILMLLATVQLMVTLDFSIVNVALPSIQQAFHLTSADLQWVISSYALLFGGLLLLGGRAADLFERKRVLVFGLTVFSLASLAGGLAPSPLIVLIARAVQGVGAAIVSPTALMLLTTTFPEGPERERALGIVGSVSGIGFGTGVILGGVLTSLLSWNWVFFVNVPLGLVTLLGALFLLPSSRAERVPQRLDLAGAFLGTGAIASFILALSQVVTPGAGVAQVLLPSLLAMVLAALFILVEQRSLYPLVPLGVFRIRKVFVANLLALMTMTIASIIIFILTLYLQGVLGFTPLATGLAFLPCAGGAIVGGELVIRVIQRVGLRRTSALGPALMALGSGMMLSITPTSGAAWVIIGYMITGVGIVSTLVITNIAATAQLKPELQGLAAGLINTSQQIGAAIGISLASVVATTVTLSFGHSSKDTTTTGYQAALAVALGLAVIAGTLAILGLGTRTRRSIQAKSSRDMEGCNSFLLK